MTAKILALAGVYSKGGGTREDLMRWVARGRITQDEADAVDALYGHAAGGVPDADAEAHIDALCEQHPQA